MPEWIREVMILLGGFLVGRAGNAVDHEMRAQHGVRTTLPALIAAQEATNSALKVITDKLTAMSQSEIEFRTEVTQFRQESAQSRRALSEQLFAQARRIDSLDQRLDSRRGAMTGQVCSVGDKPDCEAGHWVPPMDRPGWGQQTETEREAPP